MRRQALFRHALQWRWRVTRPSWPSCAVCIANCVIFYNAMELTNVVNRLAGDGHPVTSTDIVALSPCATKHILRFGDYVLDITPPTTAASTYLELDAPDRT